MIASAAGTVRRCFIDVIQDGDLDVVDEVIASDLVFHTANGKTLRGRGEFRTFAEQMRGAFPDIEFDIEAEFESGGLVCTRYTMRGTFEGPIMGLPPTGERFEVRGIDTFRVVDGRVVEIHASYDTLGQMQQLGIVDRI